MKTRIIALFAGLLAVLPMTSAWAGSYARGFAKLSTSSPSGSGKVYVGCVSSGAAAPAEPDASAYKESANKASANQAKTPFDFYFYAQPASDDCHFLGWSESDGGDIVSTKSPYRVTITSATSSGYSDAYNDKTLYANFSRTTILTFLKSENGSISATDGATSASDGETLAATKQVTMTATPDDGYMLVGWYTLRDGVKTYFHTEKTYSALYDKSTTIGADFISFAEVCKATTIEEVRMGFASGSCVSIANPVVPFDEELEIPEGKKLLVEGTAFVNGKLIINGNIIGKVSLCKYKITQGDLKKAVKPSVESDAETGVKSVKYTEVYAYRETKSETFSSSKIEGSGASSVSAGCHVAACGVDGSIYNKAYVQAPYFVKCSVKSGTLNEITGISTVYEHSTITQSDGNAKGDVVYVLLQDTDVDKNVTDGSKGNFQSTVDCATHKLSASNNQPGSSFSSTIINGKFSATNSNGCQNSKVVFVHCDTLDMALKPSAGSSNYQLYDCGPTVKLSYVQADPANVAIVHFYGGTYDSVQIKGRNASKYSEMFDKQCDVYGGKYKVDPTGFLGDSDKFETKPEGVYFLVQEKNVSTDADRFSIQNLKGDKVSKYQTFEEALDNVSIDCPIISLVEEVDLTDKTITIKENETVVLSLGGHSLIGTNGKIVNNGTLMLVDSTMENKGTCAVTIENNGNLEIAYGTYNDEIINAKAGTLTVYNGLIAKITNNGGAVELRGGRFRYDVTDLVRREGWLVIKKSADEYGVCLLQAEKLERESERSGYYTISPYSTKALGQSESDYALLKKSISDGKFALADYSSLEEWKHFAELRTIHDLYGEQAIDASVVFDRTVVAGSVKGKAEANGIPMDVTFGEDATANVPIRMLTKAILDSNQGTASKKFSDLFNQGIKTLSASLVNNNEANNGTVCKIYIEIEHSSYGVVYDSIAELTSVRYVIGAESDDVAMIRPAEGAATFYPTLREACEAAQNGETVMLCNDCTVCEPIANPCSFKFDANGFKFDGEIAAADGYTKSVENGVYTIKKMVIEIPQNTETTGVGEQKPQVSIVPDADLVKEAKEEAGEGASQEEIAKKVQEKLQKTEENGLKVWENKLVEQAEARDNVGHGFAAVEKSEVTVGEKTVVQTTITKNVSMEKSDVTLASLDTGTYQPTKVVDDANGNPVAVPDLSQDAWNVVRNASAEKTVVVAIPGETTVAKSVSSTPQEGDKILAYDREKQGYFEWHYGKGEDGVFDWQPGTTDIGGAQVEAPDAKTKTLSAGSAIFYVHNAVKADQKVVVAAKNEGILKTTLLETTESTDEKDGKWNLVANPKPASFNLNAIKNENQDSGHAVADTDRIVILDSDGLGRMDLMRKKDENGKAEWGRWSTVMTKDAKGRLRPQLKWDNSATLKKGQAMWYISNGGNPEIKWDVK